MKKKEINWEKRSPYRMGWIMAIFDLPVITPEERHRATKFRNFLLDDGYMMLQYSVYVRPCVSQEHIEKHSLRIKKNAPPYGFIRVLFFTDKQWELGINIVGSQDIEGRKKQIKITEKNPITKKDHRINDPKVPDQVLFW